jgi:uncharacterized membrane protein
MTACNVSFVDLLFFPFDGFWGMCDDISCNVFLLFFILLEALIFAMTRRKAVMMMWYAFLFLGLRHVGRFLSFFPFLLGGFHFFSCLQSRGRLRLPKVLISYIVCPQGA